MPEVILEGLVAAAVAELPLPIPTDVGTGQLADELNRCAESLDRMTNELREGEWDEVVKSSRPVAELLRGNDIWLFLSKTAGYPDDVMEEYRKGIQGTFDFASKGIHETDRQGALRQ